MEKTIVTSFMVIISVIVSVLVYNAVYPAAVQSSASLRSMRDRMDDRIQTQVDIIHVSSELDQNGTWQDTNGDGRFSVFVWAKNVGASRVSAIDQMDVFFGSEGDFVRIANTKAAGGAFPNWAWSVENDNDWNPTSTLKITINNNATLPSGRYFVKLVLPNGLSTDYFFSQ
jgi:archaellum component FlaG (FlaF/FlaG flagellin family)